jgi:hypothetical protein
VRSEELAGFLSPARVFSRDEVLSRPSPVPAASGVYGWWFRDLPALIDTSGCRMRDGLALLYVGISPRRSPVAGQGASQQNIRTRLWMHYAGNAEGSTLRKTLGCLLADQLGIQLRRVGSGRRMTFADGEKLLSAWMSQNAFVSWLIRDRPWELERDLITTVDLPLNLEGNTAHWFHPELTQVRARCVAQANALPVLPNTGRGGG